MKKQLLIELISEEIISRNNITNLDDEIENITTNLQSTGKADVVFYKIANTEKAVSDFYRRLETSSPSLVVLNRGSEVHIKNENCVFVDEDQFLSIQKKILDKIFPNKHCMKIIGVTGTNGKTTTVNLAMQISRMLGHQAISVGTIGVLNAEKVLKSDLDSTTPSYVEFRKIIFQYQDDYEACFIEVSSHALDQNRLFDIELEAAAWTSFSQDHLDYHKSMEEYLEAKLKIEKKCLMAGKFLIVPSSEKALFEMILKDNPNTRIKKAKTLKDRGYKNMPLFYHSTYNQSNVECALELNESIWGAAGLDKIELEKIKTPEGRFSIVELPGNSMAVVDYAHTPDALVNIGEAIKKAFPNHSVTVVFGCGGNRDKTKRPLMAKAVASFADKIIVTSDNPRDEAPEDIILDIINGLNSSYEAMVDRKKAIEYALDSVEENEVILIAGKGHEEYQEIKGVKHSFSDFQVVKNFKWEE